MTDKPVTAAFVLMAALFCFHEGNTMTEIQRALAGAVVIVSWVALGVLVARSPAATSPTPDPLPNADETKEPSND